MMLDLALVAIVLVFALWGAASGAAKQIANVLALVLAYVTVGPAASLFGPWVASEFRIPRLFATAGVTLVVFLIVLIGARFALLLGLERIFAGDELEDRGTDRAVGFVLGGAKAAAFLWVLLSGLTFVEDNVQIGGRRFAVSARDSAAITFVRRHNLFERAQFEPLQDLSRFAQTGVDPEKARRLTETPEWKRLASDRRVRELLDNPSLRRALQNGDYPTLVQNEQVRQLLRDPEVLPKLEAFLNAADRESALRPGVNQ